MRRPLFRALVWLALAALLVGCRTYPVRQQPTPTTTVGQAGPRPQQLVIFANNSTRTLRPIDMSFGPIARALDILVAGVDAQARTMYTADSFNAEIAPLPRLTALYGETVTLRGQGLEMEASDLVAVMVDGQRLVLARAAGMTDWAVYLSSDVARFDALVQAVQTHLRLDLSGS